MFTNSCSHNNVHKICWNVHKPILKWSLTCIEMILKGIEMITHIYWNDWNVLKYIEMITNMHWNVHPHTSKNTTTKLLMIDKLTELAR